MIVLIQHTFRNDLAERENEITGRPKARSATVCVVGPRMAERLAYPTERPGLPTRKPKAAQWLQPRRFAARRCSGHWRSTTWASALGHEHTAEIRVPAETGY